MKVGTDLSCCSISLRYSLSENLFSLVSELTGKNLVTTCSAAKGSSGVPRKMTRYDVRKSAPSAGSSDSAPHPLSLS